MLYVCNKVGYEKLVDKIFFLPTRHEIDEKMKMIIEKTNSKIYKLKPSFEKHIISFLFRLTHKNIFSEPFAMPNIGLSFDKDVVVYGLCEYQRYYLLKKNNIPFSIIYFIDPDKPYNFTDADIEILNWAKTIYVEYISTSPYSEKTNTIPNLPDE